MSPLLSVVRRTVLLSLPLAVVFVGSIHLSPPVAAQSPGSAGWSVLLPPDSTKGGPGLATPTDFYNADWTKPVVHFTGTHGPPTYPPFDSTLACPPGSDYGIETLDYDGSASPKPRALHLTIQGTSTTNSSTIKYQWTPPNNPVTSQPDLADFPAPPLFVLGRVDGRVQTTLWVQRRE